MQEFVTPKQVAKAINVSESTLKRWCDEGLLPVTRTAGGHRRLPISGVLQFMKDHDYVIVSPEAIGLPPTSTRSIRCAKKCRRSLKEGLLQGTEQIARQVLLDLYLADFSMSLIADEVIFPLFEEMKRDCELDTLEDYHLGLAIEIVTRGLNQLRDIIPTAEEGPLAIGGTLSCDHDVLLSRMCELALREQGWHALFLGCSLSVHTLKEALRDYHPRLMWVSFSKLQCEEELLTEFPSLFTEAEQMGTAVAVCGPGIPLETREQIEFSTYCQNVSRLSKFALALSPDTNRRSKDHQQSGKHFDELCGEE